MRRPSPPALAILILACTLFTACKDRSHGTGREEGNIVHVAADDAEMNAALAKARATLDDFTRALAAPAGRKGFSLKVRFTEGTHVEYLWLGDLAHDGTKFRGTIQNDPELVHSVKLGDVVTVDRAAIFDWMYMDDRGRMHGNYSARVLLKRDPKAAAGAPPFADD